MSKATQDDAVHTNGAAAPNTEPQTIDQVRELLFGSEQRSMEQKLDALKAELDAERAAFEQRIEDVQAEAAKAADDDRRRSDEQIRQIGESIKALGDAIMKLPR